MERREAIKRTAALLGGAVFAPTLLGVINGCTPKGGSWTPSLFNPVQAAMTQALSETILPKTDTPGALDAGVPGFIETMVAEFYSGQQRELFLNGLDSFAEKCIHDTGSSFTELSPEEKLRYTSAINREAVRSEHREGPPFFLMFKELVLIGFFTSEEGATQVLRYLPVPGYYEGCVPFKEIGRAWAI